MDNSISNSNSTQKSMRSILMFPWLAHGHISPYLELAKKLSKRNFFIYFISTPVNLSSIKISQTESLSIKLIELHLPNSPELPPHLHTTKGLPPHLMNTLKRSFDLAANEFSEILKKLKPDLVIYDFIQPWAPELASLERIPAVEFLCSSTVMTVFTFYTFEYGLDQRFPFPEIYLHDSMKPKFISLFENFANFVKDKSRALQAFERSNDIVLIKTFRELEGKFMDYLSVLMNKKIVPVGPLVQFSIEDDEKDERFLKWLETKKPSSTVFVSFGTEYFLAAQEREEIAHGLEISGVNFIWVLRFPEGEKIDLKEALPKGFLEGTEGRGIVVDGWAPQVKILRNRGIGGFVSHCGWSSVMESICFGVPIIGIPMHLDQPLNARLVEDVGVGMEVRRNEKGCLEREEIAKVIKEVVVGGSGEKMRRKVREMSEIVKENGDGEIDGVVDELVKLCGTKTIGDL